MAVEEITEETSVEYPVIKGLAKSALRDHKVTSEIYNEYTNMIRKRHKDVVSEVAR